VRFAKADRKPDATACVDESSSRSIAPGAYLKPLGSNPETVQVILLTIVKGEYDGCIDIIHDHAAKRVVLFSRGAVLRYGCQAGTTGGSSRS